MDPFFAKLISTTPTTKSSGWSKFRSKLKGGCTGLKPPLKQAGILFAFHLLNALVGIGGVIVAMFVLVAIAFWLVLVITGAPVVIIVRLVLLFRPKGLRYLAFATLGALFIYAVVWNVYILFVPFVISGAYAGTANFTLFGGLIFRSMVRADVGAANFVKPAMPFKLSTEEKIEALDVDASFDLDKLEGFSVPYCVRANCRAWATVLYIAVVKVIIGAASVVVVILIVILPLLSLCTGGSDPFVGEWMTFDDKPWGYVGTVLSLWVAGAIGLVVVAGISVKLTSCVCGTKDDDLLELTFDTCFFRVGRPRYD
ncbi:hypothetical protein PHYBOEH_001185 [Phytophthora boehmeriae]|uniref:Transmembrane protein n=1 Tax=Phytophthora boehmeriae TaxID=109152 RepID=A0A8T1WUK8_9STRA|nr:hypothetical protein PHYBOEH_001185 [Phytophthora boehmeriae]